MARQRDWEVAAGVEVVARMSQTTLAPRPDIADRRTAFVQEDWAARTFRVNREAFRSEDVLERERRRIWDRMWLYLGHESEVPRTSDFMQRTLAGRPLRRRSRGEPRHAPVFDPRELEARGRERHGRLPLLTDARDLRRVSEDDGLRHLRRWRSGGHARQRAQRARVLRSRWTGGHAV